MKDGVQCTEPLHVGSYSLVPFISAKYKVSSYFFLLFLALMKGAKIHPQYSVGFGYSLSYDFYITINM